MSVKRHPTHVEDLARKRLEAWKEINPELSFRNLSIALLQADLDEAAQLRNELRALQVQLIDVRNRLKAVLLRIWDKLKRLKAGIRSTYGDDSIQYKLIGGTRKSERKPYTWRKKKEDK